MADLSRPDRDRAQMILIAGFALAMTFVALALVLNSVIFTENLATRSESVGGTGPVGVRDFLGEGVGSLMATVNANNNTDPGDPRNAMLEVTEDLTNTTGPLFASRGEVLRLQYVGESNGTRYVHNDSTRAFTNESGVADWTVVNETNKTRDFGINVTRSSLNQRSDCGSERCFNVVVRNGSTIWTTRITRDGTDVVVDVFGIGGGTCRATGETVEINLTTGWVGDTKCQPLRFATAVSKPYDIDFENGDKASGTYSLITNESFSSVSLDDLNGASSTDSPRATHALYDVQMRVTYGIGGLSYQSNIRIAPGEPS